MPVLTGGGRPPFPPVSLVRLKRGLPMAARRRLGELWLSRAKADTPLSPRIFSPFQAQADPFPPSPQPTPHCTPGCKLHTPPSSPSQTQLTHTHTHRSDPPSTPPPPLPSHHTHPAPGLTPPPHAPQAIAAGVEGDVELQAPDPDGRDDDPSQV